MNVAIIEISASGGIKTFNQALAAELSTIGKHVTRVHTYADLLKVLIELSSYEMIFLHKGFGFLGLCSRKFIYLVHGFPNKKHMSIARFIVVFLATYFSICCTKCVVFNSKLTKRYWLRYLKRNKNFHVYYANARDEFYSTEQVSRVVHENHDIRVLFIGRLQKSKRVEQVLKIGFELGLATQKNVILQIIGNGPEEVRLRTLAEELDSKFLKIEFLGFMDKPSDIVVACDHADLFISLNEDEPYGLVYIEAAARGLPVILFKTAGAIEFLTLKGHATIAFDPPDGCTSKNVKKLTAFLDSKSLGRRPLQKQIRREFFDEISSNR